MTAFTLMPAAAPSHAIDVVKPMIADFATTYVLTWSVPNTELELVLTMRPWPAAAMWGHAAAAAAIDPCRCVASTASNAARPTDATGPGRTMPALFTTMSMRPQASMHASTIASPPPSAPTSVVSASATPPADRISSTTASAGAVDTPSPVGAQPTSFTRTRAPRAARSRA
jgi:hypothetical protein